MSGEEKMDMQEDGAIQTDAHVFKEPMYMQAEPSDKAVVERSLLKTGKNDSEYHMKHKKRGTALIFNFENFDEQLKQDVRKGSEKDVENLEKAFKVLQFEVAKCIDYTLEKMMDKLRKVALYDHNDCDCLAVAVMTHGNTEGLWAKNKRFQIKDLLMPFTAENCPSLSNKPKLFFIQACRGNILEMGIKVLDAGSKRDELLTVPSFTIPNSCDMLLFHAATEGHASTRDEDKGTLFIQSLCEELLENGKRSSLLLLLTSVSRRVAIEYQHMSEGGDILKQQPVIVSTLIRDVYFYNKQAESLD